MNTKEIAKKYFEFFNNADIKGLNEIYDDKIELREDERIITNKFL